MLYGRVRNRVGDVMWEPCRQDGLEIIKGHVMLDHIHVCISIARNTA